MLHLDTSNWLSVYLEYNSDVHSEKNDVNFDLLLTLNRFHTLFWCFHCWIWTCKCQLGIISESLPVFPRVPKTIYEKMFEMCQYVSLVATILYQLSLLFKVGLSPSKKIVSFKNGAKCFLLHIKSFFRHQNIYIFILTFWSCRKRLD